MLWGGSGWLTPLPARLCCTLVWNWSAGSTRIPRLCWAGFGLSPGSPSGDHWLKPCFSSRPAPRSAIRAGVKWLQFPSPISAPVCPDTNLLFAMITSSASRDASAGQSGCTVIVCQALEGN